MPDPHGVGLLLEVGELTTRHFVQVDIGRTALRSRIKRRVDGPHLLPIIGETIELIAIEFGITRGALEGGDNRIEVGLRGAATHGGQRQIDHVHTGIGSAQNGTGVDAAGVVRVKMNRQTDFVAQRLHQFLRGIGTAKTRHVLDGDHMSAHFLKFFGEADVIFQIILIALRIENVPGVTERAFANRMGIARGLHRHPQARQII